MRSIYLPVALLAIIFVIIIEPKDAQGQNRDLKSNYILCESPGQLTWFLGLSGISDLWNLDHSSAKYNPSDQVPIRTNNRKAQKALRKIWCVSTDDMSFFSAEVLEDCTEGSYGFRFPLPNGGCKKIRVKPVTPKGEEPYWTTWFTFGNSVVNND